MAPRRMVLLALLAATLAAVWWVSGGAQEDEADVVGVVKRERQTAPGTLIRGPSPAGRRAGDAGGGPRGRVADMNALRLSATGPDLFPSQSWRPPPPPAAPLPPPPPPQAPPVPYKYLGRWQEDGADIVFLAEGDRTRAARLGDRLGGQWRVDGITGQVMTLTYLPLDQKRSLRLEP